MIWVPVTILIIAFVGAFFVAVEEHKVFNRGKCSCGGNWDSFDRDSQGGTGWICDECGVHIWTSWVIDTRKKVG
jgi:hypothetical protein